MLVIAVMALNYREQSENYQVNFTPLLYSFRRCPFAIRARLALASSGIQVELREVKLSAMPDDLLLISAKATVPVLQLAGGDVIDESLDVMLWALRQSDPNGWLAGSDESLALVEHFDQAFKPLLDCYKYADRHPHKTQQQHREAAEPYLQELEALLQRQSYLGGEQFRLADGAIVPFIRQFAGVEPDWFAGCPYPVLRNWLNRCLESEDFKRVMHKYKLWQAADAPVYFSGN
ncbi:MAG: glutathione S-transferase [Gammaproteobacteria bacterium]|jgi:glutathione S-transferase